MESSNVQLCLKCSKPVHGRTDKKFCNKNCRSTWHNEKNCYENNMTRRIIAILRRNRSILEDTFIECGSPYANRNSFEMNWGFDFGFHTHSTTNKRGIVTNYCFDYGYQLLANNRIKIVHQNL